MANVTTTTAAVTIDEIWTKEVQEVFHDNLVMAGLVKRMDSLVKGSGDTVHTPKIAERSAVNKTADTALTPAANTETEFTLSIDQHKASAYRLEDIARIQANNDLRGIYTKEAGRSVAEAVDSSLTGLYSGLSQSVTGAAAVEDSEVISAVVTLDAGNVPRMDRHFVVDANTHGDLLAINKYTAYDQTGKEGIATTNGKVARVYNTDLHISNNIVAATDYQNLMFHEEAFVLAKQQDIKVESDYSALDLGWNVVAHCIYGVGEYRDEAAVVVTRTI